MLVIYYCSVYYYFESYIFVNLCFCHFQIFILASILVILLFIFFVKTNI